MKRTLHYWHHGIDIGDGRVSHFDGEPGAKTRASIAITSMERFAAGDAIEVVTYGSCDAPDAVVARAQSRLGESGYDLVFKNCEHFARWCMTGEEKSEQVKDVTSTVGGLGAAMAATGTAIGGVSAAGVAGLSGAGVMSGLATIGGAVGGGAVAGIGVLAAAPAAIGAGAANLILKDDPRLDQEERDARSAGRKASVVGGVAGTAGSIAAVSIAGVSGLSAAGITSGLAGIGAAVGGGMVAGTAIVVAAPAVAALGLGYGLYKLLGGGDSTPGSGSSPSPRMDEGQDAERTYQCTRCGSMRVGPYCGPCGVAL